MTIHNTYTIDDALAVARELEPLMSARGFHIAIGGSLVYRGTSKKDIDILIYPHARENELNPTEQRDYLRTLGYEDIREGADFTGVPDVLPMRKGHLRVDFFFMSRIKRTFILTLQ